MCASKRPKLTPVQQAADCLYSASTDVCKVPASLLATLIDDLLRQEDIIAQQSERLRLWELWRQGWQAYLDRMPKAISPETIAAIRAAGAAGMKNKKIAVDHGVSESAVSRILNGSRHKPGQPAEPDADSPAVD